MIYLDNSATSWPKPLSVIEAMARFLREVGANPGRSGHRLSVEAGRAVDDTREALARLFHAPDPLRVVFCHNATEAINTALAGLLRPGDHAITTGVEHNSVMRPLRALERAGVAVTVVPCSRDGFLSAAQVDAAVLPRTRMIALAHASNVTGSVLPIREIGELARRRSILMLVDAAQTAGALPIDMEADRIDLLAFSGHKGLLGPTGTGGLAIGERVDPASIEPLKRGGTGSRSEFEEQPSFLPDRLESGTLNAVGIAGLGAGLAWIVERGVDAIRAREMALARRLLDGLAEIPGVTLYGTTDLDRRVATVSFTVEGVENDRIGFVLDQEHDIMCRVGLHCSPAAHRTIGSFPAGTARFGIGAFTAPEEIDAALRAVEAIARGQGNG